MGPTGLRAADPEHPVLPVQIVQLQAADFPGSQPVSDEQHQDRPVTLVDRTIALHRSQQAQDLLSSQALRHGLVCHEPGRHDSRCKSRRAPAARFGKQEECPKALCVVV